MDKIEYEDLRKEIIIILNEINTNGNNTLKGLNNRTCNKQH